MKTHRESAGAPNRMEHTATEQGNSHLCHLRTPPHRQLNIRDKDTHPVRKRDLRVVRARRCAGLREFPRLSVSEI